MNTQSNPIEKWDCFELALPGPDSGNPFLQVSLDADFTRPGKWVPGGLHPHVTGFYDGEGIYKLRFMPDQEGEWRYEIHSSLRELDRQTGHFTCIPAAPGNHGPVRVAHGARFAYEDGAAYIPVGTTCYVWNLQGDALEEQTLQTLREAPFNKLRMCVFPKRYTFNHNEPPCYPFPGEVTRAWDPALLNNYRSHQPPGFWDLTRFNPAYFQRLEKRILDLRRLGIEADLILFHPYDFGAWGFDRLPADVNDRYLRYLVARLSAFRNLWWSFANEYDLMFERTMADWDHYFQLVQNLDPYNHLRSVHNCRTFYDHSKPWVTHCSVQHHTLHNMPGWIETYAKPVVVDECGYEGDLSMLWGDLSPEELTLRCWLGFTSGGYVGHGETYLNEQEQLWWSKGGTLTGQSVRRIAFLRHVLEQAPDLRPVVQYDPAADNPELDEAVSIVPEGSWNVEAGGFHGKDYFLFYYGMHQPAQRNFQLPAGSSYCIDVIDTWEMTIRTACEAATGRVCVDLPRKKYIAVRIQKNM